MTESLPMVHHPVVTVGASKPTFLPKTRVGSYEIVGHRGRGGQAEVYKAKNEAGEFVAIKFPRSDADVENRTRFLRELSLRKHANHPNVVRVLDTGRHSERDFIVTEWIEGQTLADQLRRETRFSPREATALVVGLAAGLHSLHSHLVGLDGAIVHRDLKPGNILLREVDGLPVPKIIDFGLSRQEELRERTDKVPTEPPKAYGDPTYWSPEVRADKKAEDLDDLWSLAVIAHQVIAGQLPDTLKREPSPSLPPHF